MNKEKLRLEAGKKYIKMNAKNGRLLKLIKALDLQLDYDKIKQ